MNLGKTYYEILQTMEAFQKIYRVKGTAWHNSSLLKAQIGHITPLMRGSLAQYIMLKVQRALGGGVNPTPPPIFKQFLM